MTKPIIALAGYIGAGKSEVAKHLVDRHGFVLVKFASPLKNMLKSLGLTHDHLEGHLKTEPTELLGGQTPRFAMQTLGTEWGRKLIADDLWVRAWRATVVRTMQAHGTAGIVVDDLRFPNEAAIVEEMGGKIWKITRQSARQTGHESERYIDELPSFIEIRNDFDIEALRRMVDVSLNMSTPNLTVTAAE